MKARKGEINRRHISRMVPCVVSDGCAILGLGKSAHCDSCGSGIEVKQFRQQRMATEMVKRWAYPKHGTRVWKARNRKRSTVLREKLH